MVLSTRTTAKDRSFISSVACAAAVLSLGLVLLTSQNVFGHESGLPTAPTESGQYTPMPDCELLKQAVRWLQDVARFSKLATPALLTILVEVRTFVESVLLQLALLGMFLYGLYSVLKHIRGH